MLTCIRMLNLIKKGHVFQVLLAFSLTANGRTDRQADRQIERQTDSHSDCSAHMWVMQLSPDEEGGI